MNIHQVLCWFRVAEHSFVRRKIGFQLQSSSSSSQLPQCCPVVHYASRFCHFSPTVYFAAQNSVLIWQKLVLCMCVCVCDVCMFLLPRTVYWSGRSWFCVCVCVMCACFCCAVYFAAQNCVLIWQKLVLCMCVHVRCVHVFVVQISRKQVVWSLFKTIMFKSLVSTRCSALHRAVIQLHRLWLQKSCTLQEKLFHSEYLVVDSITVLEVLQAHAYPLTKL